MARKTLFEQTTSPAGQCVICGNEALIKQLTQAGLKNMCMNHYYQYHEARSKAYAKDMGLTTVAEMRAFVKSKARSVFKVAK